jgi:putative spermidine/putrescine transport system permease protein
LRSALAWLPRGVALGILAFLVFGPLANLALWAFAEQWYFPHKLPLVYGLKFWNQVFRPSSDVFATLATSVSIALFCVVVCLTLAVPAGFALARGRPSIAVYFNVARIFYTIGLNGTISGVVLVHATHGLVFAVWIAAAAFAAVDADLDLAARNIGASRLRAFLTVTLPLAAPGIMASAIFVFLESLDEFTGTFFVGVPGVTTLPLLMFNASIGGNYQIAAITALILLIPSVGFMLFIERFLKAEVLAKVGG